jgi:dienelactone hydrolase
MAAKEKLIDAFVLYHPSMVEADEAAQITVPVLINAAELDPLFGGEAKDTWFKTLKEKNLLDEASTTYP